MHNVDDHLKTPGHKTGQFLKRTQHNVTTGNVEDKYWKLEIDRATLGFVTSIISSYL